MDLIAFVINLVILCIVLGILYWIVTLAVGLLPFPQDIVLRVVQILFALIVLIWLLSYFQGGGFVFYRGGHGVIVR